MNLYAVLAMFLLSSAIILSCLDHLKMRLARNLFLLLIVEIILYIPYAMCGEDIASFCASHQNLNLAQQVLAFLNYALNSYNVTLLAISLILCVVAVVVSISTIILVVHTAKTICKLVQSFASKRQRPKLPQKQTYQRKLVHSKIQYKRILYLRFCRLIS